MASSRSATSEKFLEAAHFGDLRLVKKFAAKLDNGGEVVFDKIRDIEGRTALHIAAIAGNTNLCKYLVKELKLDVNSQDKEGQTPLLYATLEEHLRTSLYLMDNGADVQKTNNMGFAPMHYAALSGRIDFLQLFISRGAEIEANSHKGTPLVCAIHQGNREAVELLLQNNANHNAVMHDLATPIMLSIFSSLEITDLLVKAGADPNDNGSGLTPLHLAVSRMNVEVIIYLLKAGANPNILDCIGVTPLECAAILEHMGALIILFPVTKPIPYISDWSIGGLMRYFKSEEAKEKMDLKAKQLFHTSKSKGEDAFKRNDYNPAIFWYSRAIRADPSDARVMSNRSLCYTLLHEASAALYDAESCVRLRPYWPKAHYREGVAWKLLKNYEQAVISFNCALKLDPDNQEIQKALQEVFEVQMAAMGI